MDSYVVNLRNPTAVGLTKIKLNKLSGKQVNLEQIIK